MTTEPTVYEDYLGKLEVFNCQPVDTIRGPEKTSVTGSNETHKVHVPGCRHGKCDEAFDRWKWVLPPNPWSIRQVENTWLVRPDGWKQARKDIYFCPFKTPEAHVIRSWSAKSIVDDTGRKLDARNPPTHDYRRACQLAGAQLRRKLCGV